MSSQRSRLAGVAVSGALLLAACGGPGGGAQQTSPPSTQAPDSTPGNGDGGSSDAAQLVAELVEAAREEGEITLTVGSTTGPDGGEALAEAFKERFGLDDFELHINADGRESNKHQEALVEHQSGAPPAFDVLTGTGADAARLVEAGAAVSIDNFEALLEELNPEADPQRVSPGPLAGHSLVFAQRGMVTLLWNTERVTDEETLPEAYVDLADPEQAGRFALSQHVNEAPMGILAYDRDEWLALADQIGQNAEIVLDSQQLSDYVRLGQGDFAPHGIEKYYEILDLQPDAPVRMRPFTDYMASDDLVNTIRTGTESPAAATLWALWRSSPEAHAIQQPYDFYINLTQPSTELDQEVAQLIEDGGTEVFSWFETQGGPEALEFYASEEGSAYLEELERAFTQRAQ